MNKTNIIWIIVFLFCITVASAAELIIAQDTVESSYVWFTGTQTQGCQNFSISNEYGSLIFQADVGSSSDASAGYCWLGLYDGRADDPQNLIINSNENRSCSDMTSENDQFNWTFAYVATAGSYTVCANSSDITGVSRTHYHEGAPDIFVNGSYKWGVDVNDITFRVFGTPPGDATLQNSVTLNSPADNAHNNSFTNNYCYTPLFNTSIVNCQLFTNETGAYVSEEINQTPVINGSLNCFSHNIAADGTFDWSVFCTGDQTEWAIGNFTFIIDTENPAITILDSINNSYYKNTDFPEVDFYATDQYIYDIEFIIFNSTDTNISYAYNSTASGTTLKLNRVINISTWAEGEYFYNYSASDAHTDNSFIPKTDEKNITDGVEFTFDDKDIIKVEVVNIISTTAASFSKVETIKLEDRIAFALHFTDKITSFDYRVTADSIVQYNSPYFSHLILDDKYWWDSNPYPSEIISIDKGVAIIRVSGINTDKVTTESLGGLNIVTAQGSFEIDSTAPQLTNATINLTTPLLYDWVLMQVYANETNPALYRFAWNYTGTMSNLSLLSYSNGETLSFQRQMNSTGYYCFNAWANDTANNVNSSSDYCFNVTYYDVPIYDKIVTKLQQNTFSITFINITATEPEVVLNYNNTEYAYTSIEYLGNNKYQYNYTIIAPEIYVASLDKTFHFSYNYSTFAGNTTSYTQEVKNIFIAACNVTFGNATINISFYDEETLNEIWVDGELIFDVWYNNPNYYTTYTFNFSHLNNYAVCISGNENLSTNAYIKYVEAEGFTHRYYLNNATISKTNMDLELYNFNDSTGISQLNGIVRHTKSYNFFPDVYVKLLRYYVLDNTWRLVQMDKSDEFGQLAFHVKEQSTDYKFIFEYDGQTISLTDSMKFICNPDIAGDRVCILTFPLTITSTSSSTTFTYTYDYNNETGIITMNFNEATGVPHDVYLRVLRKDVVDSIVCNASTTGSSGTLTCNISGIYGTLQVYGYHESTTTPFMVEWIIKELEKLYQITSEYKGDMVLLSSGLLMTTTIAGALISPVGALLGLLIGLIGIFTMKTIFIPIGIFVLALLMIFITIPKAND